MRRIVGIAVGLATQLLFLFTVWHLFWFLKGEHAARNSGSLWIDGALALQFAIPHSLLLLPAVRRRLVRWINPSFYGCFYSAATCLGLLLTFSLWRSSPTELWRFEGWAGTAAATAFIGAWVSLMYSLNLTGLGFQTGLTQWWQWVLQRPLVRPAFKPRGAYRLLRHPVYLSFLGLLWFTPVMTLDRAVLTGLWTVYLFIGSYLKDERLAFYSGEAYRVYLSQVAGYPFIPFGPLAKRARILPLPESGDDQNDDAPQHDRPERRAA